jgi:hypothetical protein
MANTQEKKALKDFTKHFQWRLMQQLKSSRKKNSENGKILIPVILFNMFKQRYGVTGRFKVNVPFMNSLNLCTIRYINRRECCKVNLDRVKLRVGKTSKASKVDQNLIETKLESGYYIFSYQFVRQDVVL